MPRKVRRSGLMMPINNPRFVNNSWRRNSDSLDFDLEDSVPQSQKEYARSLVKQVVPIGLMGGSDVSIRINTATPEADIAAALWPGMGRVAHPKTESPEQIKKVDALITKYERLRGIRAGSTEVTAMIESALGVCNAYEIASASPRVKAFGGGGGYDMSLDLGVDMFVGFNQVVYGTGECELVARALGKEFGVSVYMQDTSGSVSDAEATYLRAVANRKAGGRTGGGLHPNVVDPQNRGLTPPPEEVDQARRILAACAEINAQGEAEGSLDGQAIDPYEAARAAELVEWARLCAEKDAFKESKRREAEGMTNKA